MGELTKIEIVFLILTLILIGITGYVGIDAIFTTITETVIK